MNVKHYIFIGLSLLGFVSCSEADDDEFDSAEWKNSNELYFEAEYQTHSIQTDTKFVLPSWGQPASRALTDVAHTSCVLVDVLSKGLGESSPYYTDSVSINYSGSLIPTEDYPNGYVFETSYLKNFDPAVDVPVSSAVAGFVEGFSTALQQMHLGDKWRVIIPYQMGYGTVVKSVIPAYSTLVFEIELVNFWSKEKGDRDF